MRFSSYRLIYPYFIVKGERRQIRRGRLPLFPLQKGFGGIQYRKVDLTLDRYFNSFKYGKNGKHNFSGNQERERDPHRE
jgi:hypothetical protein